MYTFAPCPVNNVAALLARHLFTNQAIQLNMLDSYHDLAGRLVGELSGKVLNYADSHYYGFDEHLLHYPPQKRDAIYQGMRDLLCCKPIDLRLDCFTKTGEW